jgi:hypothetical protein
MSENGMADTERRKNVGLGFEPKILGFVCNW